MSHSQKFRLAKKAFNLILLAFLPVFFSLFHSLIYLEIIYHMIGMYTKHLVGIDERPILSPSSSQSREARYRYIQEG